MMVFYEVVGDVICRLGHALSLPTKPSPRLFVMITVQRVVCVQMCLGAHTRDTRDGFVCVCVCLITN